MSLPNAALAALFSAFVVCYAHYEIPHFTLGFARREVAHGALLVVAFGFGVVCASVPDLPVPRWLAFAAGFGIVHVPAAAILFIKRMRGSGLS
jgi:hypothetical protein